MGVPSIMFGQTSPNLGAAGAFALFSSVGAVSNTGTTNIIGYVGSNSAGTTNFGNVNGQMHSIDSVTSAATFDLNLAYHNLGAQIPTQFLGSTIGGGVILKKGVYSVPAAATLSGTLILDGNGNSNSVFIFQVGGAFATDALSKIVLKNGANANNVFWKVDGAVTTGAGTIFKGTVIADGAIELNSGTKLEGRALAINGAVTVRTAVAAMPVDPGKPLPSGPLAPNMGATACYSLFTASGNVTNTGSSTSVAGLIGTDMGVIAGFNSSAKTHTADASTSQASDDLSDIYTYINALKSDIELLYPVQFGSSLILTPHVYIMKAAAHLTDTIILDAQGNANAVFVININGAFTTEKNAYVLLRGGAKAGNIFWKVEGSVEINDKTHFEGTIIAHGAAITLFNNDVLYGRALSTKGAINTFAVNIPSDNCTSTGFEEQTFSSDAISVYPNPVLNEISVKGISNTAAVSIFDNQGRKLVVKAYITDAATIDVSGFNAGIYFVKIDTGNGSVTKKFIKL